MSHHGLQGRPCDDGGLQLSESCRSCGSGLLFLVLPCVSTSVVVPTPAWFFPGPSKVVQVTVPWSFVQLSGSGAAPAADTPRAETAMKHAGTMAIAKRLIETLPFPFGRPKALVMGAGPVSDWLALGSATDARPTPLTRPPVPRRA
jgi:hypothetical protein